MDADYALDQKKYLDPLSRTIQYGFSGKINKAVGLTFEAILPGAAIGSICRLNIAPNTKPALAEVIGFRGNKVVMMPLEELHGINNQSEVKLIAKQATIKVSEALIGRVLDGSGIPIDGLGPIADGSEKTI